MYAHIRLSPDRLLRECVGRFTLSALASQFELASPHKQKLRGVGANFVEYEIWYFAYDIPITLTVYASFVER